jgi:hypothetical protein
VLGELATGAEKIVYKQPFESDSQALKLSKIFLKNKA